jgi:hypothetical protein
MVLQLLELVRHQLKAQQHQRQQQQQQHEPLHSVDDEIKDAVHEGKVNINVAPLKKEIMKILFARGRMEKDEASAT